MIEACGGSADAQRMCLHVSTGRRVLTTRNQLLNILRNTVACYAGAVADADIITTTPFDAPTGLPTEASRRNARNTQHILAEECHLAQVVDPAGGSWYIEWYSNEAAKRAWSLFQEIEAQGGMIRAFASGWVGEQIKPAEAAREKDIAVRKVAVTGISVHPSLTEKRPEQELPNYRQLANGRGAAAVELATPARTPRDARYVRWHAGRERPADGRRDHRGRGRAPRWPDRRKAGTDRRPADRRGASRGASLR